MRPALVSLLLSATPPSDTGALRAELQASYEAYAAACVRQDYPAAAALLAPDVHWTLADGTKLDRAGVESSVQDFLKTLGPGSSARYTLRSVKRNGEQVLVDVHLRVTTVLVDADHPGKVEKHVGQSGWHDVWVRGPSGWLYQSGEEYELPAKR